MEKTSKVKFPSIETVAAAQRQSNASLDYPEMQPDPGEDEVSFDVRLLVWPDGEWTLHTGDSQYDQDHRGFWGASSLPGAGKRFNSVELARDLVSQARDMEAQ